LLPRFAVTKEVRAGILSTIAVKELMEDPMVFCVCVLNSRSVSPAAQVFVDAIVDFCQCYIHQP
jgi:DNA-binding transcriptional LysR family regulator